MFTQTRAVTKDEELGKRDDDYSKGCRTRSQSVVPYVPWRWRKRLVVVCVTVFALYILLQSISPSTSPAKTSHAESPRIFPFHATKEQPPRDAPSEEEKHDYNGRLKFTSLAGSLASIAHTSSRNRNILFATSLGTISNLLPMACSMAAFDKNFVHVAILGRSSLSMEDILSINGVDIATCRVHLHDARPDLSESSTDLRIDLANRRAMAHISKYMRPQAVVIEEDGVFSTTMRKACNENGHPVIGIPSGMYETFLWLTRLSAESLSKFTQPNINIVIRALPGSSGSLIRLLKSLAKSEYRGLRVPQLSIELPPQVEPALQRFLADFRWPPSRDPPTTQSSLLSVHHRIPSSRITSEMASLRFVELFYPRHTENDNVLVLSPQAEVGEMFLHFLQYHILEYRYASWFGGLAGISLHVPTESLAGNETLDIPTMSNITYGKRTDDDTDDPKSPSPFLYQAPSSTATLFFGDKWAVFHDFLTKRMQVTHSVKDSRTKKMVSETEPAWMEYLLELMRVRGWNVLHPSSALVTVHNELAQIPEEYQRPPEKADIPQAEPPKILEEEAFLVSDDLIILTEHAEHEMNRHQSPIHQMLPFDGALPALWTLPRLNYDGSPSTSLDLADSREEYVVYFRETHGGCRGTDATRRRTMSTTSTDDLFCLPDTELRFADDRPSGFEGV